MGKYRLAASNRPRVEPFLVLSIRTVLGDSRRLLPILKMGRTLRWKAKEWRSGFWRLVMLLAFGVRGVAGPIS